MLTQEHEIKTSKSTFAWAVQPTLSLSKGAAPEALPQAPAPAEVPHPAPDQGDRAALLREIHSLIFRRVRQLYVRHAFWVRSSLNNNDMVELHSRAANQIMDWELDLLPGHTDTESLREWVEATATSKGEIARYGVS